MSNLPLVRFLISAAAHTDSVWYGSLVSYTCAHFSFCCASAGPPAITAAAATAVNTSFEIRRMIPPCDTWDGAVVESPAAA